MPRLIDNEHELRNNRLDIGVRNEIVCRARESYEYGTWMTAFTTVRNAELKGETAEEHGETRDIVPYFLSSSSRWPPLVAHSRRRSEIESENDNDRNITCDNGLDRICARQNPQDHVSSTL